MFSSGMTLSIGAVSLVLIFIVGSVALVGASHFGTKGGDNADFDNISEEMLISDTVDPSLIDNGYTQDFICTVYYPASKLDPMGGDDTTADGTKFWRDPKVSPERNLFAKTPDGMTIQGVVATVQDQHSPVLPWVEKDNIKLDVPAYFTDTEIHDHFATCVTDPRRLDLAMSGPEQESKWRSDLKTACPEAKPYQDPGGSNYNCGTLVPVNVKYDMPLDDYGELSDSRKALLSILMAQLGKPYVSGAAGPNAFDCSGLVLWVYHQIGNSKPTWHHTDEQAAEGKEITAAEALPGDCIYFGVKGDLGHVGIYIGDGKFIHAPHSGDFVKITNLNDYHSRPIGCWIRFMDPGKDVSPSGGDPMVRSNRYLDKRHFAPGLKALASYNIEAARARGMDWRMALVCAFVESSGGNKCFHPNNPFGLGQKTYPDFKAAIDDYYATVSSYGLGTDAYQIFRKYRGADNGYADNCVKELNSI